MNQVAAEQAMLRVAETIERALDDEIQRVDNMDDDELAELRKRRLQQVKEVQQRRDAWLKRGHGGYGEITDTKHFYEVVKGSERVVVHFMRRSTSRCSIIERHLRTIAQTHFETRFAYVDVERIPVLAEQFNILMLPTLMLIEGQKTFHSIIGFDEFGGVDDFPTSHVVEMLAHYGMINENGMFAADQSTD